MHSRQELGIGVIADACLLVRRDVGGIDGAERHVEGEAACEGRTVWGSVAGLAVRGMGEIFAALHQIGTGKLRRNAGDIGVMVTCQRHGRAAGEGHRITAKKQPSRETEREDDNDRNDNTDDFFHVQAGLAAAFLIARRMRI
jgi:hypothetical protein